MDYLGIETRGEGIEDETVALEESCCSGDGVLFCGAIRSNFLYSHSFVSVSLSSLRSNMIIEEAINLSTCVEYAPSSQSRDQ